jgi:pimeloyl-ACP methyl ester carboxylesterase
MAGWYTDVGRGPPVVILASTLVVARSYVWTIDCLAPHCRVVTVEMPGAGRATPPPRPWGFEDYGRWVAGFVRELHLGRPTVVGHSNSGGAALVAAAMHPDRVGRLVLADTVGGDVSPSLPRVIAGRALDAVLVPRLTLFGWHHVIGNALVHTKDFFGQVWKSVYDDLRPHAARVRAPTLLAWGARDHTIPIRCAHALRELIPGASLYVSPRGSHDWLIDRAPEFAGVLRAFIDATPLVTGDAVPSNRPSWLSASNG